MGRNVVWIALSVSVALLLLVYILFSHDSSGLNTYHKNINKNLYSWILKINDFERKTSTKTSGQPVYDYIDKIKQDCGELCDTSRNGTPGLFFNHINSQVNCKALYMNPYIDMGHNLDHAPNNIPKELLKYYNMDGRISISPYYFDRRYLGGLASKSHWTKEDIENKIDLARMGKLKGAYGANETNRLRDGLKQTPGVLGGRVLVIGSESPWVEACVLEAGAKEVLTLEYGKINSEHGSIKTMVPDEFRMGYLDGSLGMFDAVVTFSSIEHSGLGRYGDALNPWGDIIAISKAWCVTKPNGGLAIGVPFNKMKDNIQYNAHRVYGSIRYPYLTSNWNQVYQGKGYQRVFVFSK